MGPTKFELTFIVKREGNQCASLCLELDIASCGRTKEEAIKSLKDAVETYIQYIIDEGRIEEIYRPVPIEALREFLTIEEEEEKKPKTFDAIPIEYSYA